MLMDLMYTVRFDPEEFVSDFSEAVEIQHKYFCYISISIWIVLNEMFYLCIVFLR